MDPEDTLMRCLEGWRVHCPLFFFLLRLFRAHVGGALCSLLNLLRGLKVEKGGGGVELVDVLTFFCLRVKVAVGAVSMGNTTLTLVLD
jgi:hypothetical protein